MIENWRNIDAESHLLTLPDEVFKATYIKRDPRYFDVVNEYLMGQWMDFWATEFFDLNPRECKQLFNKTIRQVWKDYNKLIIPHNRTLYQHFFKTMIQNMKKHIALKQTIRRELKEKQAGNKNRS